MEETDLASLTTPHCVVTGEDQSQSELSTRTVLVFRRLEPGDVPNSDAVKLTESAFIDAIRVPFSLRKATLAELADLTDAKGKVLAKGKPPIPYEPIGFALTLSMTGALAAYFLYLPRTWFTPLAIIMGLTLATLSVLRLMITRREATALREYNDSPSKKRLDDLSSELRHHVVRWSIKVKEQLGYLTELRLVEQGGHGRLASIDPRWLHNTALHADPEDFKATEGDAIRYEFVVEQDITTRFVDQPSASKTGLPKEGPPGPDSTKPRDSSEAESSS